MKENNFFVYRIDDVCGIVIADTEKTAKEKVISAYKKHGYPDVHSSNVFVVDAYKQNNRFADCSDVIECGVMYE